MNVALWCSCNVFMPSHLYFPSTFEIYANDHRLLNVLDSKLFIHECSCLPLTCPVFSFVLPQEKIILLQTWKCSKMSKGCAFSDSSSSLKWISFFFLPFQSYSSQGRGSSGGGGGAGDEDYEIPPITPPNHADPSLLHLMEHESGYPFHSLPHNGLLNTYSYPELPALMMSNMLGQDTHLLSGPMHSVSKHFLMSLFRYGPLWSCTSSTLVISFCGQRAGCEPASLHRKHSGKFSLFKMFS